ncbi:hypothetical protein ES708_21431 [subsurface metagenome]
MTEKMKCKHGEFDPMKGCPQCTAEKRAEVIKTAQAVRGGDASAVEPLLKAVNLPSCIVKVQYSEGSRGFTYYSMDRLQVGDIVWVPVRDTTARGTIIEIDVPASEVEAFKDKVKTIPAGSKVPAVRPEQEEMEDGLNSEGKTLAGAESEALTYRLAATL